MTQNFLINLDGYQLEVLIQPLKKIIAENPNKFAFHCASIEDKKISQAMQVSTICSSEEKNLLWNRYNFDFYDKKKSIENFLSFLNISSKDLLYSVNIESIYSPILHPGKSAIISYDKKEIGFVGEMHPEILAEYNIKKGLVVSTIFLSEISIIDIKPKTLKSFSN